MQVLQHKQRSHGNNKAASSSKYNTSILTHKAGDTLYKTEEEKNRSWTRYLGGLDTPGQHTEA